MVYWIINFYLSITMLNENLCTLKKITIFYATNMGQSFDAAKRLFYQINKSFLDLEVNISGMDSKLAIIDSHLKQADNMIFYIIPTYGDGDPPVMAKNLWKFIFNKNLSVPSKPFCVIGLGNSNYNKYNFSSKKLFKRLLNLGMENLSDLILIDENHPEGVDQEIENSILSVKDKLQVKFNLKISNKDFPIKLLHLTIQYPAASQFQISTFNDLFCLQNNFFLSELINVSLATTNNHPKEAYYVTFNNVDQTPYSPGDLIWIKPSNIKKSIEKLKSLLCHLDFNKIINFADSNGEFLKSPVVLDDLVESYFDINSRPKISFFIAFASIATENNEKKRLKEFASIEEFDETFFYSIKTRRTILEVFEDFPSTTSKISYENIFDLIPPIKPRSYSICSSFAQTPNQITILIVLVSYKTQLKEPRYGTCTKYLIEQNVGAKIPIQLSKGVFGLKDFTDDTDKKVLMVGPGTGVAPFLSFIKEQSIIKEKHNKCCDMLLFFGCQFSNKDNYVDGLFEYLKKLDKLLVFSAYSRNDPNKKVYVQHIIMKEKKIVGKFLRDNKITILIAGAATSMPQMVLESFEKVLQEETNMDENESKEFISKLRKENRIQIESWK